MINIFVPIIEDVEAFSDFVSKHNENDVRIFVGIKKSLKEKFVVPNKNIEIHIFDDRTKKEEMINALQRCEREKGALLVVRRPLSDEEYRALTSANADITTLKPHQNKFVSWLKRTAKKIIRKVFAFSYFDDISAVCLSENMHEFILSCPNLSMASRIDKYVGLEIEEIETNSKPTKKEYDKINTALLFAGGIFLLLASIVATICVFVYVEKIRALYVVLVIAMLFVALTIFAISLVSFLRTLAVGTIEYKVGTEIEIIKPVVPVIEEDKQEKSSKRTRTSRKKNAQDGETLIVEGEEKPKKKVATKEPAGSSKTNSGTNGARKSTPKNKQNGSGNSGNAKSSQTSKTKKTSASKNVNNSSKTSTTKRKTTQNKGGKE